VVTGVSGSGKTTLIKKILYPAVQKHLGNYSGEKTGAHDSLSGNLKNITQVELVDQNPIGKSSRSNPITYIKAYDWNKGFICQSSYSQRPWLQGATF
jgi:excinuclease ABC subunit A